MLECLFFLWLFNRKVQLTPCTHQLGWHVVNNIQPLSVHQEMCTHGDDLKKEGMYQIDYI